MMPVRTVPAVCPLCGPGYRGVEIARGRDFEYDTTGDQEFHFLRCGKCAIVLIDPRPADEEIAGLYPSSYIPYHFDKLPGFVRRGRDWVQRKKVDVIRRYAVPEARVVDVGCGAGAFLRLMRAYGSPGWKLVGWDYPAPHMDHLRAEGFEVISAAIDREQVPHGTDVFVLNQVIEHFANPGELIALLAGALAPGGHLVMETPDTDGLDARWFGKRHWGGYHIPRHLALFNQPNLRALVERSGLRVVATARLSSPAFWVQSLHHRAMEWKLPTLAGMCSLSNFPLVAGFSAFDLVRSKFGPTSNQRLVAVKPA